MVVEEHFFLQDDEENDLGRLGLEVLKNGLALSSDQVPLCEMVGNQGVLGRREVLEDAFSYPRWLVQQKTCDGVSFLRPSE